MRATWPAASVWQRSRGLLVPPVRVQAAEAAGVRVALLPGARVKVMRAGACGTGAPAASSGVSVSVTAWPTARLPGAAIGAGFQL